MALGRAAAAAALVLAGCGRGRRGGGGRRRAARPAGGHPLLRGGPLLPRGARLRRRRPDHLRRASWRRWPRGATRRPARRSPRRSEDRRPRHHRRRGRRRHDRAAHRLRGPPLRPGQSGARAVASRSSTAAARAGEVVGDRVGRRQLARAVGARRHGDAPRAAGPGAGDVARRVADHDHPGRRFPGRGARAPARRARGRRGSRRPTRTRPRPRGTRRPGPARAIFARAIGSRLPVRRASAPPARLMRPSAEGASGATAEPGWRSSSSGIERRRARHPPRHRRGDRVVVHAVAAQHEPGDLLVGAAPGADRRHVGGLRRNAVHLAQRRHEGGGVRAGRAVQERPVDVEQHQHGRGP